VKVGLVTWGRTLGELLLNSDVIRPTCMSNLLRMDRMRRAEGLPSMLVGNRQTVEGHERAIALAFHAGWMYGRRSDWQSSLAGHSFEQELRQDARFHESTLKRTAAYLHQVFSENSPSNEAAAVSARMRFERMLSSFVDAGLLSDELEGSAFARRLMLPPEGRDTETDEYGASDRFYALLAKATFDEAHHLLHRWAGEGHCLDAMHDSVQAHLANSPWMAAANVLKTQHDMSRRIEAGTPAVSASSAAAPTRARRRHGI
jgi:hypothetical protein